MALAVVSRRAVPPAVGIVQMSTLPSVLDAKAISVPSGENAGEDQPFGFTGMKVLNNGPKAACSKEKERSIVMIRKGLARYEVDMEA